MHLNSLTYKDNAVMLPAMSLPTEAPAKRNSFGLIPKAALVGVLATLVCLCVGSGQAEAAVTYGVFCPSTAGSTIALNAYPGRCVGVFHTSYVGISFDNALTPVRKCAIIKPNSDGSGGDLRGGCPSSDSAATYSWAPGVGGYATGINNSGNYHTGFFGQIAFS